MLSRYSHLTPTSHRAVATNYVPVTAADIKVGDIVREASHISKVVDVLESVNFNNKVNISLEDGYTFLVHKNSTVHRATED
jgi:hypothetical protein